MADPADKFRAALDALQSQGPQPQGPGLETYFVSGLGYAIVIAIPAIAVVLFVALFTRSLRALLLAGTLPPLFVKAVNWAAPFRLGVATGPDPVQEVFDFVLSLIAGALVGWGVYEIKRRFDPVVPRAPQMDVAFPKDSDEGTMGIGAKIGLSVLIFVAGCGVAGAVHELYGRGQLVVS